MEKKIYFLSDFHLGVPDHAASLVRERRIVHFLELAAHDAQEILVGMVPCMAGGIVRRRRQTAIGQPGLPVWLTLEVPAVASRAMLRVERLPLRDLGGALSPHRQPRNQTAGHDHRSDNGGPGRCRHDLSPG